MIGVKNGRWNYQKNGGWDWKNLRTLLGTWTCMSRGMPIE